MFDIEPKLLFALMATQLVFALYGAGLRRPFGSLRTVLELPENIRLMSMPVKLADALFALFLIAMWTVFILNMNVFLFMVLAAFFAFCGEILSKKLRLVPSFFVSLILATASIWVILNHPTAQTWLNASAAN